MCGAEGTHTNPQKAASKKKKNPGEHSTEGSSEDKEQDISASSAVN